MYFSGSIKKLRNISLALAVALAGSMTTPLVFDGDASAQSKRSGVILKGRSGVRSGRVVPRYRDPALRRLGFRKSGRIGASHHSSGVRLGLAGSRSRGKLAFVERARDIRRYNAGVAYRNEVRRLRSATRRSQPNGRFLSRNERQAVIYGDYYSEPVATAHQGHSASGLRCPSRHNCGYRLYSDGTGPRLITPYVKQGGDLPLFDGVSGPKVITLD